MIPKSRNGGRCGSFSALCALWRAESEIASMNHLKFIWLTIVQFAKQVWLLPQSITMAIKQKRQWMARNKLEAERLDRIRNPEKYLGK
jgi:hypothetical protein